MALDVPVVQAALRTGELDGWLLYDFRGSNAIALGLTGLARAPKMLTRRWFYLIPAVGAPAALVHAIERHNLDALPGEKRVYADRESLTAGLQALVAGRRALAMEYSPGAAIPYLSRVDAGTVELVRSCGVEVVSSGDLVQQFEAAWDEAGLAAHRDASERLHRIKDRTFEAIARAMKDCGRTDEYRIQQLMVEWFQAESLVSDSAPVVAAAENAGNPHYLPTAERHRPIGPDELVLLDLWGKRPAPGAVYADISWVGFTGRSVPAGQERAFEVVCEARDRAVALVKEAAAGRRVLRGWEVDRAAREVIEAAGFGAHVLHRTGHSLGEQVHGNGVNLDDYETHDDRRLLPGSGFTIEPGLYFDRFGVRTEINMYVGETDAVVTGPVQTGIVQLA